MKLSELAAIEAERQQRGYRALYLVRSSDPQHPHAPLLGYEVQELTADDAVGFPTAGEAYAALDRLLAAAPDPTNWLPGPVLDGVGRYVPRAIAASVVAPCERSCCRPTHTGVKRLSDAPAPDAGIQVGAGTPPAAPIPVMGPLRPPPGVLPALNARVAALHDTTAHIETAARQARLAADREDGDGQDAEPRRRRPVSKGNPEEVDYDEGGGEVV